MKLILGLLFLLATTQTESFRLPSLPHIPYGSYGLVDQDGQEQVRNVLTSFGQELSKNIFAIKFTIFRLKLKVW